MKVLVRFTDGSEENWDINDMAFTEYGAQLFRTHKPSSEELEVLEENRLVAIFPWDNVQGVEIVDWNK